MKLKNSHICDDIYVAFNVELNNLFEKTKKQLVEKLGYVRGMAKCMNLALQADLNIAFQAVFGMDFTKEVQLQLFSTHKQDIMETLDKIIYAIEQDKMDEFFEINKTNIANI